MKFLIVIGKFGSDTTCPRFAETQVVDNMHLLTDTPGSIRKYDDAWVIGELYNRDDGSRLVAKKGTLHRLLTHHWGGYVAIKPQPDGDQYEVLVDPSGGLPCYVAMTANAIILGSEAAEVLRVADLKFVISWDTVYSQLLKRDNRSDKTCLTGLQEIPPGCIGEFKNHSLTLSPGWRPEPFARHARNRLPGDDSRHLRSVVQSSVCAMAQTKGKILIPVSGGLDSSVVALALSTAGADIALFTMYSEDRNGDERYYARELATHLGKELIERPYRVEDVDISQSCVAALPARSAFRFSSQSIRRRSRSACNRTHQPSRAARAETRSSIHPLPLPRSSTRCVWEARSPPRVPYAMFAPLMAAVFGPLRDLQSK